MLSDIRIRMSRCFGIKRLQTESFDQSDLTDLKWLTLQEAKRNYLTQTQTLDLGTLRLEDEDIEMKKSGSDEELFEGLKIVQKKEGWYRTGGKRRHSSNMGRIRKYQSLDMEDQTSDDEHKPKLIRLQSETDLLNPHGLKCFDSEEIDISDFYMKVPTKTC